MEGQGVAASSASAAGRKGQSGAGGVAAADPGENHVTSDVEDGGEGRGVNGDDSHVIVTPGYPEASAQDASMPPSPEQASSGQQPPREPQLPTASHEPESDKRDNITVPVHDDEAPAMDEDKGHDQSAAHVQLDADAELAAPAEPAVPAG